MSTLKSPLSRGSDAPHVHQRLRKHLARCTLDCGFKTPESPALRGFVAERCPVRGTSLYLAFFFVLEKAAKSAENAVIPTYPMHRSHGLQGSFKRRCKHPFPASINGYHAAKNGLGTIVYKMAHVCLHSRKRVHTRPSEKDRTQALTRRNRGCFRWGAITTLGLFHTFRKTCVARG